MRNLFAGVVLAGALMTTPAMAASVLDGGFETQGASALSGQSFSYCYFNPASGAPDICNNAGNPAGGNSGLIASNSGPWGGTSALEGGYYSFVQSTGTLTQQLSTGTGSFRLSWSDHARTNNGGPQTYSVGVSGVAGSLGTFTSTGPDWTSRQSAVFALGAGSHILTFTGLSGDDRTSFIDAVSIAAVPEAGTWAMMILGLGMVGGAMRSRRKSVAANSFA